MLKAAYLTALWTQMATAMPWAATAEGESVIVLKPTQKNDVRPVAQVGMKTFKMTSIVNLLH